jgi:hypothetical protein
MTCPTCGRSGPTPPTITDPDRPTADEVKASGERLGLPQWLIDAGLDALERREKFATGIEQARNRPGSGGIYRIR